MSLNDPVQSFIAKSQVARVVISVDIDNTLAFFTQHLLAVVNAESDSNYDIKDQKNPGMGFLKGKDLSYAIEQHSNPAFFATMAPDYAAIAAVQAIKDAGYYVIIASSRGKEVKDATVEWLNQWGVPYNEVMVGHHAKSKVSASHSPYNPCMFIDDNPHILDNVNSPGTIVRLLHRPYTGVIKYTDNIKVVDTWQQILTELNIMEPTRIPQLTSPPLGWQ